MSTANLQLQALRDQMRQDIADSSTPGDPFIEMRQEPETGIGLVVIHLDTDQYASFRRCAAGVGEHKIVAVNYCTVSRDREGDLFQTIFFCDPGDLTALAHELQAEVARWLEGGELDV